ncbi:hypothetical protein LX87_04252 [Larkinella arboricola]|uniref:Uncharacterized protein n=1 Tax=Larkinella arboricola TaxID=643671 RepID=A0A327WXV9_LARAB|nr:hypothetical protein LX87_04252 [Larkinella arboricola]
MEPVPIYQSPPLSQKVSFQEVSAERPQPLNALQVAKWGFIELLLVFIVSVLFRKMNRHKPSKSLF